MSMLHQMSVEATGVGCRAFLKRCIGLNKRPKAYKEYKHIMTDYQTRVNQNSCTKVIIDKTYEEIAQMHGFSKETLETLQTVEFMENFHRLLISKGYKKPSNIIFAEMAIPSNCGIAGAAVSDSIRYNPRCMKSLDFRIPIHETGHALHKEFFALGNMFYDNSLYSFGKLVNRVPFIKKLRGGKPICHLSSKEQDILKADYRRAWEQGFFKHNPFHMQNLELLATLSEKEAKINKNFWNKTARDFRKTPEEYYLPNSLLNRQEFIADYFNLAAQGFEFSPEITAKYKKYHGPEIKEIITPGDLENLEKLRKQISKKTLADYGYTLNT